MLAFITKKERDLNKKQLQFQAQKASEAASEKAWKDLRSPKSGYWTEGHHHQTSKPEQESQRQARRGSPSGSGSRSLEKAILTLAQSQQDQSTAISDQMRIMMQQQETSTRFLAQSVESMTAGMENLRQVVTSHASSPDVSRKKAHRSFPMDSSGDEDMLVVGSAPSTS